MAPLVWPSVALSINNHGAVVGTVFEPYDFIGLDIVQRAFVWQPDATIPGLTPNSMFMIPRGDDFPADDPAAYSIAFGINDDGDIVGDADADPGELFTSRQPFIWSFRPGLDLVLPSRMQALPTGAPSSPGWGGARAISNRGIITGENSPTAFVAGAARTGEVPSCTNAPGSDPTAVIADIYVGGIATTAAARWDLRDLQPTSLFGSLAYGEAYGHSINPRAVEASTVDRIVGLTLPCIANQDPSCDVSNVNGDYVPRNWFTTSDGALSRISADGPFVNGAAFDVNDVGTVVGFLEREESGQCASTACVWTGGPSATLLADSPYTAGGDTRALAINSSFDIVGVDGTVGRAILWPGTTGLPIPLSDQVDCAPCGLLDVLSAVDINDSGWIVGQAAIQDSTGAPTQIGVLLVPHGSCRADVDRDGDVDATDLALVQTSNGSCPDYAVCWADLDGDCDVDQADVKIVLTALKAGASCEDTLPAPLAELWLSVGGAAFLQGGPAAAEEVATAVDPSSPGSTFANLMLLLDETQ